MHLTKIRDLKVDVGSEPGRPAHLSAASGLVRVASTFYVVADDELHLGAFPSRGDAPGRLLRILPGELPEDPKARKKAKPDFEALTYLPASAGFPQGALFALGSGSKKNRRFGVMIPIEREIPNVSCARVVDAHGLFDQLANEVDELNIEGALAMDDRFLLLHRGNKSHSANAIFALDLSRVLTSIALEGVLDKLPIRAVGHYELGRVDGIPLCFTDGAALVDGRIVFSAVAEDTLDSYRDGPCAGAAIGTIGVDGSLESIELIDAPFKIEGIHAEEQDKALKLWLVSDADDVNTPAALLLGTLERRHEY